MKKTILTTAIVLSAAAGAFAQTAATSRVVATSPVQEISNKTDATKLQVELKSIQTIEVANKPVVLSYKTKEDYMAGVSSTETDHVVIFSTGGYAVKVKADNDLTGNDDKTIESKGIFVRLAPTTNTTKLLPVLSTSSGIPLTKDAKVFFKSGNGAANDKFSVVYEGAGDGAYLDNYKEGATNIYKTTVTYSIEAI